MAPHGIEKRQITCLYHNETPAHLLTSTATVLPLPSDILGGITSGVGDITSGLSEILDP